jgi:hypothetical protein
LCAGASICISQCLTGGRWAERWDNKKKKRAKDDEEDRTRRKVNIWTNKISLTQRRDRLEEGGRQ